MDQQTPYSKDPLCNLHDLNASWPYFERHGLHKLSTVDATSFAIMKRAGLGDCRTQL